MVKIRCAVLMVVVLRRAVGISSCWRYYGPLPLDDCIEDCTSVSSSEGDTIRVGALLECSLLDCSSPELCGSVSDSELSGSKPWGCRMRGTVSATSAA